MGQTKYYCTGCGSNRFIPERPSTAKRNIRAGCETCNLIQRHKRVGVR